MKPGCIFEEFGSKGADMRRESAAAPGQPWPRQGIELYPGASGDADQAVEALLNGSLDYDPNTMCSHHHEGGEHNCHGHGHSCGGHN